MWIEWIVCIVLHIYPVFTQKNEPRSTVSDDLIPCESGWFYFGNKCYKIEDKAVTQKQAVDACIKEGGNLVTIQSKELNDFLVTFLLLDAKLNAWIGLHDRINETKFEWEDGSEVNYTNWEPREPSGVDLSKKQEDCVEMFYKSNRGGGRIDGSMIGQWNDVECSSLKAYICESEKSNNSSPDPRFCPDMREGWKLHNSCYHVVDEEKSWEDAEQHCQDIFNGHLVTILYYTVDNFLQYIVSNFSMEWWIGIKMREQYTQQWTSGWYVGYNQLEEEPRKDFVPETCAVRSTQRLWKEVSCSMKYSFICETSSVEPPVLKKPAEGYHCPERLKDWYDFGGENCYFIDTKSKLNWNRAKFRCNSKGSFLVSIHSEEESRTLLPFIKDTQHTVIIGLHRLKGNESVFVWSDGSPMDYTNWGKNEPSSSSEKCGEMWTGNTQWNDVKCDHTAGYICSAKKVLPGATVIPTERDYPISPSVTRTVTQRNYPISPYFTRTVTQRNYPRSSNPTKTPTQRNYPLSSNTTETPIHCNCPSDVSIKVALGVIVFILLAALLISIGIYWYRRHGEQSGFFFSRVKFQHSESKIDLTPSKV